MMVLSLATHPDPASLVLAARRAGPHPPALQRIAGYATLRATEGGDGRWSGFRLDAAAPGSEPAILASVGAALTDLREREGMLVTFDGHSHELPILHLRSRANWSFNLDGLSALLEMRHLPISPTTGAGSPMGSLREVCAGLGIPADPLAGGNDGGAINHPRGCQVRVVGTFLILLHEVAAARRSVSTLAEGWRALAGHISIGDRAEPHLAQFAAPAILTAGKRN